MVKARQTVVFNILLIVCGIFLIGSGIWCAFMKKHPIDAIGAFFALAGLVSALIGTLLTCVPNFFH
jgi:hypothetical membrane protein